MLLYQLTYGLERLYFFCSENENLLLILFNFFVQYRHIDTKYLWNPLKEQNNIFIAEERTKEMEIK